jgi:hypothetical protein
VQHPSVTETAKPDHEGGPPDLTLWQWLRILLSGKPHYVIGGQERPYLLRWFLIPRNHRLNIYLHKFMRDDDDRALHDHPWWFVSVMLWGRYKEFVVSALGGQQRLDRRTGSAAFRPAVHRHRVELFKDEQGQPQPCWTLVITGRKSRTWGFWCNKGFVPWYDFVDRNDSGAVGPGCGD